MGAMKRDIKDITYEVRNKCNLRGAKPVPHISLVSNPTPHRGRKDERRLIADFNHICAKYPAMESKFNGFGHFDNFPDNGVAKINIIPSEKMLELRWDLINQLRSYCALDRNYDASRNFYTPHATIAMKLNRQQLGRVMNQLARLEQPNKHYYLARATLLKNSKILSEYDFFLRKSLTRSQALSKRIQAMTQEKIRRQLKAKSYINGSNGRAQPTFNFFHSIKRAFQKFSSLFR
jgi:2'-5' RNA ligase